MNCEFCGTAFSDSCGRYGCPNCHGEGLAKPTATPRTDALEYEQTGHENPLSRDAIIRNYSDMTDLARTLERELAEAVYSLEQDKAILRAALKQVDRAILAGAPGLARDHIRAALAGGGTWTK